MNEHVTVAQGLVEARVKKGMSLEQAYDHAIGTLEAAEREYDADAKAREKRLRDAGEPELYIEAQLKPFATIIDGIIKMLQAVRKLKAERWQPKASGD